MHRKGPHKSCHMSTHTRAPPPLLRCPIRCTIGFQAMHFPDQRVGLGRLRLERLQERVLTPAAAVLVLHRHPVRGRDEEGCVHHHALPHAQARHPVPALRVQHRGSRGRDPLLRSLRCDAAPAPTRAVAAHLLLFNHERSQPVVRTVNPGLRYPTRGLGKVCVLSRSGSCARKQGPVHEDGHVRMQHGSTVPCTWYLQTSSTSVRQRAASTRELVTQCWCCRMLSLQCNAWTAQQRAAAVV